MCGMARLRGGPGDIAQGHGRGPDFLQEQLQPERTEIFPVVAVFGLGGAAGAAGLDLHPPPVLIHALPGFFMNQLNLRPVDFVQRHAGLAGLDLRLEGS